MFAEWQEKAISEDLLSADEAGHDWFGKMHYQAAKAGIAYAEYQGLTEEQAGYLIYPFNLKRIQVEGLESEQLRAVYIYRFWISNAEQVRGLAGDALYAAIQSAVNLSTTPLPEHATLFRDRMDTLRQMSDELSNHK